MAATTLCAVLCVLASCSAPAVDAQTRESPGQASELEQQGAVDHDWERACELYRDSLRTRPDQEAEVYLAYAQALRAAGRNEESYELLDRALVRHPVRAELYELRGDTAVDLGFHRSAECDYEAAALLCPAQADLWQKLGEVRLALDLPAAARSALLRCLELEPATPERLRLLALSYTRAGEAVPAALAFVRAPGRL